MSTYEKAPDFSVEMGRSNYMHDHLFGEEEEIYSYMQYKEINMGVKHYEAQELLIFSIISLLNCRI